MAGVILMFVGTFNVFPIWGTGLIVGLGGVMCTYANLIGKRSVVRARSRFVTRLEMAGDTEMLADSTATPQDKAVADTSVWQV